MNGFTLYGEHKSLHFWEYITPQEGICGLFVNARLILFFVVVDDDDDDYDVIVILSQVIWTI